MSTHSFRQWIRDTSKERGPIVLALDYNFEDREKLLRKSIETLKATSSYICCVKINRQLVLPLGLYSGVKEIIDVSHTLGIPTLMDCKINDVGSTNQEIARHYFRAGFDAVTASPFVGWDEGLKQVFELAHGSEKGVILLVYMSHRGAAEGYGQKVIDPNSGMERPQYLVFGEWALAWNADGVVVGATYPEKISEVNYLLKGQVPIYSPGVGVQGGDAQRALDAGATYLIIGRSIISAENPADAARKIREVVVKR
ncbi:MAG: orotidine 5'-phosphate decarboxylase [Candidatus Bathyarchaeota archaeon]